MGLIKAGVGALGGALADQWKEFFYCDALDSDTLVVKGQKRTGSRSGNSSEKRQPPGAFSQLCSFSGILPYLLKGLLRAQAPEVLRCFRRLRRQGKAALGFLTGFQLLAMASKQG